MDSYGSAFARAYDLIYRDKPYQREAEAVNALLSENGVTPPGRLLDLACGTGRHSVEFSRMGWTVTGVDASEEMLRAARANLGEQGLRLVRSDMRSVDLGMRFNAIVSLFDSIGYAGSRDGVRDTFERVADHLESDGLFIFEVWHAPAMVENHDPVRIRRFPGVGGRDLVRISETAIETDESAARVEFTFFVPRSDGLYERYSETHRNMFFTMDELGTFLESAGLEAIDWRAGLLGGKQIVRSTWHIVGVARKA